MRLRPGDGVTKEELELAISIAIVREGWTYREDDFGTLVVEQAATRDATRLVAPFPPPASRIERELKRIMDDAKAAEAAAPLGPGLDPDAPTEIEQ